MVSRSIDLPAKWEIERRVCEVASEECGIAIGRITLDSRLIEDLDIESLAVVEFVMALEDAFLIKISDEEANELFSLPSTSLHNVAHLVEEHLTVQRRDRTEWTEARSNPPKAEEVPFTQLGPQPLVSRVEPLYRSNGINREEYREYVRSTDGMRCILIPGGTAWLGTDEPQSANAQQPAHSAHLSDYLLDAEPVSNLAYARFFKSLGEISDDLLAKWCGVESDDRRGTQYPLTHKTNGWKPNKKTERQPMVLVSWYGANAYSLWAHGVDWRLFDEDCEQSYLPTEAQWEHAAAKDGKLENVPWTARHIAGAEYTVDSLPMVSVSERHGMSRFGAHHLGGNVWQWCRDWYSPDFYRQPGATGDDPENLSATGVRSERGGSWVGPERLAQPTYRRGRVPLARGRCLGFRCCAPVNALPD